MKADHNTEMAVREVLDCMADAYEKRDINTIMNLFVHGEDVFAYGTGKDEKRYGRDQVQSLFARDWEQSEETALEIDNVNVWVNGNVAWTASDVTFRTSIQGQSMAFRTRLTMVLERSGNTFLIAQCHISVPATNQNVGESFPGAGNI